MKDCTNTFYSPIKSQEDRKRRNLDPSVRSSSPKPRPMTMRVVSNEFNTTTTAATATAAPSQTDDMIFEVTPTSSPPSKRRRVRFDASVHVQYAGEAMPDKVDASAEKTTDIWYSRKEIETCRKEVVDMLKRRKREAGVTLGGTPSSTASAFHSSTSREGANPSNEEDMSFRGVEDLLSKRAFQDRRKRKRVVVEKVLTEQARQVALKIVDPEGLGMKSQLASKSSRDLALNRGSRDAMMAYIH
mmetsp:Transcript_20525/g.50353  ORF Transcript_20525/g.50353 Transcript_20525/m.50353 type:complete len:244 (+) Transcript_20525:116-847(+)